MGFAEQFFEQVGEARAPTVAFVSGLNFAAIARPFLLVSYQVMRATTPVLRHALMKSIGRDSPLVRYYANKLRDEAGHDSMFLKDLQHAEMAEPDAAPPNPFVAEMVGRQYYLVDFVHPAAYLGYIGFLEGFQPTVDDVDDLARLSGLPPAAFRTMRMHAAVDIAHKTDLARRLDEVPANYHHAILDNGIRCAELHRAALVYLSKEKPHGLE